MSMSLDMVMTKVTDQIKEGHIKLLSEINLTDEELKLIRNHSKLLVSLALNGFRSKDILSAYVMMDVGMRNYHDGAYWDDLWNEVEVIHSSNDQSTLGQFFIETIKRYDLAVFREEKRKYVNNIMMHAFIPENEGYRDAFFNFVLRFYRIVLNSSVPEDLDEKLQTMADVFRENSLSDYPEMSSIPLIASTKYALSDVSYFGGTVRKIIRRFAQDYDTVEEVNLGRYEESYRAWINSHSNGRVKRRSIGEKPYVHFNIDRNQLMLVIPAREVSRAGNIPIEVEISGEKRTDSVVATVQFGKAITEEKVLIMNWNPLSPFVVRIDGNQIMKNEDLDLMILNRNGNQRHKVALGFNMVVIPKGTVVNLQTNTVYEMEDFSIEAFIINRGELLDVSGHKFAVEEEISADIHVVSPCLDISCEDQDGNRIDVYAKHPVIRIGKAISKRFKLTISHGFNVVNFDSFEQLASNPNMKQSGDDLLLDLSSAIKSLDGGVFRIRYNGREMYRYLLIRDFEFHFERNLYEEDEISTVYYSGNLEGKSFDTKSGVVVLDPLTIDGSEFTIILQVPSRRFSFDKKNWHMFGEVMYYRDTQASEIYIYCPTLVYPIIKAVYKNSKPIMLTIEGRYLKCEFSKISQIGDILEYSNKSIFKLKFMCGRFPLFVIRYSSDYCVKGDVIVRKSKVDNTVAEFVDKLTGYTARFDDSFKIPPLTERYQVMEYYDDGFGEQGRIVLTGFMGFQIPGDITGTILAGDDFGSIFYAKRTKSYNSSDFKNLIDIDSRYDPDKQKKIEEKYQAMEWAASEGYQEIKKAILKLFLSDSNYIRLKSRAKRFADDYPEVAYELCCVYQNKTKRSDLDELKGILEKRLNKSSLI